MTSEELQAMLAAAYSGQINPANMGLNSDPRSEWESEKYNQARQPNPWFNERSTDAEAVASPMALSDYPKVWYDRTIGQAFKGAAGAGDALLGRTNPDLETFNKDVLDALSLYAGPTIAKGMLGGVPRATELSIFGGVGAKEAPLRMRDIAEKALAAGKDPDEVWKVTGWKPGMEGKMRFEISDKDMALNPEFWGQSGAKYSSWMDPKKNEWADVRMGQVAKHDAAYANYPEMRDVKVRLGQPESMGGMQGFYDEATNTATIKANLTKEEARDVLLHEVGGHYVQKAEDFARGGNLSSYMEQPLKPKTQELERVEQIYAYRKAIESGEISVTEADKIFKNLSETDKAIAHKYPSDVLVQKVQELNPNKDRLGPFDYYEKLGGEIEANDIVNRRTWDTDMRRAVPPDMRKDAIIRMGEYGERQMSVDVKKPWEMTRDELAIHYESMKNKEEFLDLEILGSQKRVDEFNKAHRKLNSSDPKKVEEGYKTIDEIEKSLTVDEKNSLYGVGKKYTSEDFGDILDSVGILNFDSPKELGHSLRYAVTKVGDLSDPSKMNMTELKAYFQIKTAFEEAQKLGWNTKEISDYAIRSSSKRFGDKEDAAFMLDKFKKQVNTGNPDTDAFVADVLKELNY